jgi:hypothetical protein
MLKHNSKKNIDLKKTFNLELKKSIKLETIFDLNAFENSIRIYINKPQVVNKWVNICFNLFFWKTMKKKIK